MDADRWQRLQDLLLEALDLPAEARDAFLDRACADDPGLVDEVRSLLQEEAAPHSLFDEAAGRLAHAPSLAASLPARRIGPYRVLEELGQGGMGVVYLAEREDVSKRVALKLVRGGLASAGQRQRFLFERRVLARLEHPSIARLLDAGVTDPSPSDPQGLPYFAMEYVDGAPLTGYCDTRRLSVDDRLRLFEDVCAAVEYAHRRLIVHRDLKPSNILVTEDEAGKPHVKLLDFGIAKLLEDDDDPMLTQPGARLMTPPYAAPEQIQGEPVTTATDVYALGVVLYELLTGRRPFEGDDPRSGAAERALRAAEPTRPSTAVAKAGEAVAARFSTNPERLRRRLRGDLDTICLKALRKEPERRYASAGALLEDLRRHGAGRPVEARPATIGYQVKKFVGRHRVGVAGAATLVLLLLAFGLTSRYQARQTARALVESESEREKAEEVSGFLLNLLAANDPGEARGDTLTAPELLARGLARVDVLEGQPLVQAQMLRVIGEVYQGWGQFAQADTLLKRALALYRQNALEQDEVVETLLGLGWNEAGAGRFAESGAWFSEALAMARRLHGEEHLRVAQALRGIGIMHRELGQIEESVYLHRESLALYRRLPTSRPDEMARLLNDLGWILIKQGQFAEGDPLIREALERFERVHGADHPFVGTLANNLGEMYRDWGRPAEAEPFLRRGLALRSKSLGNNHLLVAHSLENIGRILMPLGRLDEAEALLRESLRIRREALGARHPVVTRSLFNLGWALQQQARYEEAEAILREALSIARETRPARHLNPAMQMFALGRLLIARGQPGEAVSLLETSAAIYKETYGAGHYSVAEVQSELGHALTHLGRFDEAEPLLLNSHTRLQALRPEHFTTARARQHLVAFYEASGQPEVAATFREASTDGR